MRVKDGKTMFKNLIEGENGKETGQEILSFVNQYGIDKKGFLEGALENKKTIKVFSKISLLWLLKLKWQYYNDYYDGRNEYSVKTGSTLASLLQKEIDKLKTKYDGSYIDEYDYREGFTIHEEPVPYEILFIEKIAKDHRTLQQSFSGIVFEFLSKVEKFNDKINSEVSENFYRTPLV